MNILEKLKIISANANAEVSSINYGGCAVMAAIVGEELEKHGIRVEGVPNYGNPALVRKNKTNTHKFNMRMWENNGIGFGHVALRFRYNERTYTWDTDRLVRSSKEFGYPECFTETRFGQGLTIKELKRLSWADGDWNTEFNRKDIPKLKRIVKNVFNKEDNAKLPN